MSRVVVVGDVVSDIVVVPAHEPERGTDTPASVTITGGGAAANVAAWLADLGTEAHLVGRVGDDAAGRERTRELTAAGVALHLVVDPGMPTGTVVVLVAEDGERTMLSDRGANLRLGPRDLPAGLVRAGTHLHVSGYSLHAPQTRATVARWIADARRTGCTVSVDPASAAPLRAAAQAFLDSTAGADVCLPNLDEARVLTGAAGAVDCARRLVRSYPQAVVTCGADGAVWSNGGDVVTVPAVPAAVVDTTGAGDAFTAGFLSAWLAGRAAADALERGTAVAARALARPGARP